MERASPRSPGLVQTLGKRYGEGVCQSAQADLPDGQLCPGKTAFETRIPPRHGFVRVPPPKKEIGKTVDDPKIPTKIS